MKDRKREEAPKCHGSPSDGGTSIRRVPLSRPPPSASASVPLAARGLGGWAGLLAPIPHPPSPHCHWLHGFCPPQTPDSRTTRQSLACPHRANPCDWEKPPCGSNFLIFLCLLLLLACCGAHSFPKQHKTFTPGVCNHALWGKPPTPDGSFLSRCLLPSLRRITINTALQRITLHHTLIYAFQANHKNGYKKCHPK